MDKVTKMWTGPLPVDSPYIKAKRLYYIQDGKEKNWDLLQVHDSVSIIIYNKSNKSLVFVKQFRPPVYYGIVSNCGDINNIDFEKFPPKLAITLELCAGIVDKNKSFKEIAKEEVLEECGYEVPLDSLESVLKFRCNVGTSGAEQEMFFCEVTEEQKVNKGGGIDDEIIEVVEYSIPEAAALIQGSVINSPPSFLFGVLWFLNNKCTNNEYKNN
ncbi:uridine diphosphate glucose pyrophosphatase NUDT14-like isoform X2 [Condylostylus longicornis]|nr:uridine diphosphate glucose pyrophosphatase NUDT14-like isoform X2 [Condylostylus longicornis]XP_055376415.1 uridine diphosphate glucose pyrophosphatase NUDT14-like isoform X2 [Condylostylus longicornis]